MVLGLMSGTSADGVDAVLAKFYGSPKRPRWKLINTSNTRYPEDLRKQIIQVEQGLPTTHQAWSELAELITDVHAKAALTCDPEGDSKVIGCHGQTLWHKPPTKSTRGQSLQIIKAPLLAELLQKTVVYDFRAADIALGGQGAPLVPLADEALIGRSNGWCGLLNVGGIANITLIPPQKGPDTGSPVLGWDCGPGNSLIDLAVYSFTEGKLLFDHDGAIAQSGIPNEEIIKGWIKEPFFQQAPPKSTGREKYGLRDLKRRLKETSDLSQKDQIATLTAFTAAVVAQDIEKLPSRNLVRPINLLVAGGGQKNIQMMQELKRRCLGTRVSTIEEKGVPSQSREALAFALLAWWHVLKVKSKTPSITGAKHPAVLGIKVEPNRAF